MKIFLPTRKEGKVSRPLLVPGRRVGDNFQEFVPNLPQLRYSRLGKHPLHRPATFLPAKPQVRPRRINCDPTTNDKLQDLPSPVAGQSSVHYYNH